MTTVRVVEPLSRIADESFRAFVLGSQSRLLHVAELLTGDRGHAEDLLQHAFIKTYLAWSRIEPGNAEAYTRAVLLNGQRDWWRRRTWVERPSTTLPDTPAAADTTFEMRDAVLRALKQLTLRERQVVVLRYYLGSSEREIAQEIGVAVGTVKSTHSRALTKLRANGTLLVDARQER